MELITIQFGSVGASWFTLLEQRGNSLIGLRWTPGYRNSTGSWNLTRVKATEATDRRPTCPRPTLPTAEVVEKLKAKAAKRTAAAKVKVAAAKAYQKRLDAGEQIAISDRWYNWTTKETVLGTAKVVGTKGRFLLCNSPGRTHWKDSTWNMQVLPEDAVEVATA